MRYPERYRSSFSGGQCTVLLHVLHPRAPCSNDLDSRDRFPHHFCKRGPKRASCVLEILCQHRKNSGSTCTPYLKKMLHSKAAAFSLLVCLPGILGQGAFPAICPMEGCLDKCCNIDCMDDCRFNKELTCQACMPNCCKSTCFQYCGDNVPMEAKPGVTTDTGAFTQLYSSVPHWATEYVPQAGIAAFAALNLFAAVWLVFRALVSRSVQTQQPAQTEEGFLSTGDEGAE